MDLVSIQGVSRLLSQRPRPTAVTVAILLALGLSGVLRSYTAAAKAPKASHSRCTSKSCKSKTPHTCKKGEAKKQGKCVKTPASEERGGQAEHSFTPNPGAPAATLNVHVSENGQPDEQAGIDITKTDGEKGAIVGHEETSAHTIQVVPGVYEVRAYNQLGPTIYWFTQPKILTVKAGETVEITLEFNSQQEP